MATFEGVGDDIGVEAERLAKKKSDDRVLHLIELFCVVCMLTIAVVWSYEVLRDFVWSPHPLPWKCLLGCEYNVIRGNDGNWVNVSANVAQSLQNANGNINTGVTQNWSIPYNNVTNTSH